MTDIQKLLNRILNSTIGDAGRTKKEDHDPETGQWASTQGSNNIIFSEKSCPKVRWAEPKHKGFWDTYIKLMNGIKDKATDKKLVELYQNIGNKLTISYLNIDKGFGASVNQSETDGHITTVVLSDLRLVSQESP